MSQVAEVTKDLPPNLKDWAVWFQDQSVEVAIFYGDLDEIAISPFDLANYNKLMFYMGGSVPAKQTPSWSGHLRADRAVPIGKARLRATFP